MPKDDNRNTAAVVGLGLVLSTSLKGSLIRHFGDAAAKGYRPSLFSMATGFRAFAAAPAPVKAAAVIAAGTTMLVKDVAGLPGVKETVELGMKHFEKPIEELHAFGQKCLAAPSSITDSEIMSLLMT